MNNYSPDAVLAALPLGKNSQYVQHYNAALLRPVPRQLGRASLHMAEPLPFHGQDSWTLYELSWLNSLGLPQVAIGRVEIDASSLNLPESKSFKLYLNSFNQTVFADWQTVRNTLQQDLSACVQGHASVSIMPLSAFSGQPLCDFAGDCIDDQPIRITDYLPAPHYLADAASGGLIQETLVSHLLKSNCLITQQPDWASLQISYQGNKIDREKLLRYLVSLRQCNEFHEQCVEHIFSDIWRHCRPQRLTVYARYTRRGGLDINPWRSNDPHFTPASGRLARQ